MPGRAGAAPSLCAPSIRSGIRCGIITPFAYRLSVCAVTDPAHAGPEYACRMVARHPATAALACLPRTR